MRSDRLFQALQILRRRRICTAEQLAEELEVSVRTVYRYMSSLSSSGVPIEAEPGVGYRLRDFDLPPMMFSREEVKALVLGARLVKAWADADLVAAAGSAVAKIGGVVPRELQQVMDELQMIAPPPGGAVKPSVDLATIRRACEAHLKVRFRYADAAGQQTERTVRPLGIVVEPPVTTLAAWCELRKGYRSFQVGRMRELEVLETSFKAEAGCCLEEYQRGFVGATQWEGSTSTK